MAQENNQDAIPSGESESPPKRGGHQIAGVAPISSIQATQAADHRPGSKKQHRNRFAKFAKIAAVIAGVCAIIYLAKTNGVFTPEWIQTALTLILAVWAGLQWFTYHRQWKVMRQQVKMARRQLRQAVKTGAQTDAVIEQMRLENRAWLSTVNAKIKPLSTGYKKVTGRIYIKNTGNTPARIIFIFIRHFVRPTGYDSALLINEFERERDPLPEVHASHPNEMLKMDTGVLGEVDDGEFADIWAGKSHLHIFVRFRYRDISEDVHEEKAWFTAVAVGPKMKRQADYCGVF